MAVLNDDIVRGVVEYVLPDGSIAQNVYTYEADFAAEQSDADVRNAIESALETAMSEITSFISDEVTFNPFHAYKIAWDAVTSRWEVTRDLGFSSWDEPATSIDEALPNQMAATITAPTRTPKRRGRKFIPSFAENSADAGILTSAALTALALFGDGYIDTIVMSAGNDLISGVVAEAAEAFSGFDSVDVPSVMGTQRRRKPGVGA